MGTVKFTLDPKNPPELTPEQRARLGAMTDEEITAAAQDDPDNPPMTEEEIDRIAAARAAKIARRRTGLTQREFARRYRINFGRLRDIEQARNTRAGQRIGRLSDGDRPATGGRRPRPLRSRQRSQPLQHPPVEDGARRIRSATGHWPGGRRCPHQSTTVLPRVSGSASAIGFQSPGQI